MLLSARPNARTRLPRVVVTTAEERGGRLLVQWRTVRNAEEYELRVVRESDHEVVHEERCDDVEATVVSIAPDTRYTVSVRACVGAYCAPWGIRKVTTMEAPMMPTIPASATQLYADRMEDEMTVIDGKHYGNLTGDRFRYCTFCAGALQQAYGALLELEGLAGDWRLTRNNMLADTVLQVAFVDAPIAERAPTGVMWRNANALTVPRAARDARSVIGLSADTVEARRITFERTLITKWAYVRIGLPNDGRRISGIQIKSI